MVNHLGWSVKLSRSRTYNLFTMNLIVGINYCQYQAGALINFYVDNNKYSLSKQLVLRSHGITKNLFVRHLNLLSINA